MECVSYLQALKTIFPVYIGNCISSLMYDTCGLKSVPIRCGFVEESEFRHIYQPTLCLCNVGYKGNDTCLGKV